MMLFKIIFVALATFLLTFFTHHTAPAGNKTQHITPSYNQPQALGKYITPTNTPTITSSPDSKAFLYPHATVTSQSQNTTYLSSVDDPTTISTWYRNVFSQSNMQSFSIITSSTGSTVDDQLVGDTNTQQVKVTIHKDAAKSDTAITITISSSKSGNVPIENNTPQNLRFY